MTSNGQREEIQKNVFQVPNVSRITRRDSREDTGHSSALETERKWYGTLSETPEGKWDATATQMVARELGSPRQACHQQAAADPGGSRTCVCAGTHVWRVAHSGRRARIHVLPWNLQ